MADNWKLAALGGLGGAAIAVVIVLIMASTGTLPVSREASDARIHEYLMRNPEVLVDMSNKMQADQAAQEDAARQTAVDKIGLRPFFDPKLAFVTGPANAKTTLVEFFDYNCPYCRASLPAVKKFYDKHKNDTRFAFIEFPIKGPNSIVAAHAAIAGVSRQDSSISVVPGSVTPSNASQSTSPGASGGSEPTGPSRMVTARAAPTAVSSSRCCASALPPSRTTSPTRRW